MDKKEEKLSFSDKLGKWIYKNRVILISVIVIALFVGIACAIIFSVINKNTEKKFAELDTLVVEYASLNYDFEKTEDEKALEVASILESITALADDNASNGVGLRAYMTAAEINFNNEDYQAAIDAWLKVVEANNKAYTAPLSLYQIAVSYEELGDIENAISYLEKASEYDNFSLKSKALFNQGRLEESRGNYAVAVEKYNSLVSEMPYDEWAKLAKSRVIFIETENLLN